MKIFKVVVTFKPRARGILVLPLHLKTSKLNINKYCGKCFIINMFKLDNT